MNTPRTDAAWSATFDSEQISAGRTARALREHSQQLETELAAFTTERDQLRADANEAHAATHHWCNRAELAEAELAAERARLDWLESPAGMDWQWQAGISRATIDAKMKKDAK